MKGQASQSSGGASGLPAWWGGHAPMMPPGGGPPGGGPISGMPLGPTAPMGGIAGASAPATAPIAAPFASTASAGPYGMHAGIMAPGMPIGGTGGNMAPSGITGGAAPPPGGVALGQPAPMMNNTAVPQQGNPAMPPQQGNPAMPPQFANFMSQLPPGLLGALQSRFGGAGSPLAGLFSMMGR